MTVNPRHTTKSFRQSEQSGRNKPGANHGSSQLTSFAHSRPVGQHVLQGTLDIPAGAEVEKDMPDFLDAFTKAVQGAPRDQDNLPARFADAPVMETTTELLEKLSRQVGPKQANEDEMGYSLMPTRVEHGDTPGLLAVDLAPADFNFANGSMVGSPVARLFVDTTPGQDGIQYLLTY